jgi:hypothetical protein
MRGDGMNHQTIACVESGWVDIAQAFAQPQASPSHIVSTDLRCVCGCLWIGNVLLLHNNSKL